MADSAAVKRAEQRERRRRELSEKATAFYAQHNVTDTVERLLNEMFVASPRDVYGYMSNYFSNLAVAPVISSGKCTQSVDERGRPALDVSIHCTVHGVDKFVASVSIPVNLDPPPSPPPPSSPSKSGAKKKGAEPVKPAPQEAEDSGGTDKNEKDDLIYAFESFNTYIAPALVSHPPNQQSEIDTTITSLRDKEGRELHKSALLATSLAVAKTAAQLSSTPVYNHLASALSSSSSSFSSSSSLSLPTPLTSLLAGGCGKLRVREFCILPLPGRTLSEQISCLGSVYHSVGTLLSAKTGMGGGVEAPVGPRRAYCPPLDRLEAGLDLVREAGDTSCLTLGQDFSVVIDIGADRLFDQEKNKYELLAGQWKSTDDLISFYTDLLTSQTGLMGYIDPLHHKDVEGWRKLQEALGSKCLVVADRALADGLPITPRPGETKEEQEVTEGPLLETSEETPDVKQGLEFLSCASISLEKSLSATFSRCSALAGVAKYTMLSVPHTLTADPLLVDVAVTMKCTLLRLGAPCGVTSTCLLSRMLQIKEEMSSEGTYEPPKALVFSSTTSLSQLDQH